MAALLNGAVNAISGNPYANVAGCGELQPSTITAAGFFIAFPLLVVTLLKGIRGRTVPLLVPAVALLALTVTAASLFERITHCQTIPELITFFLWMAALALMCLHHLVQRSEPVNP
jgi:hypothetical protein